MRRPSTARAEGQTVTREILQKAKYELYEAIQKDQTKAPALVRLAWSASGTYDKMSQTGGSERGTLHFREELEHSGNEGLKEIVDFLEDSKVKVPTMSYGDFYTLAGVVALKFLDGPTIPWRAGRVDSMDPKDVPPADRLPRADYGSYEKDAAGLRAAFYRMGFDDRAIVCLSGAHCLGEAHVNVSGFGGPWNSTPKLFTNNYFAMLKYLLWEPGCTREALNCTRTRTFRNIAGNQYLMMPTDFVLIIDPEFSKYVDMYADDKDLFYKDFQKYFSQLLELGCSDLYTVA